MASTVLPNGIIIPEKYSRDWYADLYHNWEELDNLLGGGTPKDGTLTIQKNGATVGTFSANQATNETINITVPDANDFVPRSGGAVMTGALSRSVNDDEFSLNGGTSSSNGASVNLRGKDKSTDAGTVSLVANDGTNSAEMLLRANGNATWNGSNILTQNSLTFSYNSSTETLTISY